MGMATPVSEKFDTEAQHRAGELSRPEPALDVLDVLWGAVGLIAFGISWLAASHGLPALAGPTNDSHRFAITIQTTAVIKRSLKYSRRSSLCSSAI